MNPQMFLKNSMDYGASIVESAKRAAPFDKSQYLKDNSGNPIRFINDPLDESYIVLPGDMVSEGMIPPEEFQVRASLVEMKWFTDELMAMGFFSRLFCRNEYRKRYDLAREKQQILYLLVNRSPEHKAAIRRIVNAMPANNGARAALADYIK